MFANHNKTVCISIKYVSTNNKKGTYYLYVWKYSPEYYAGTEVTTWPFNVLTAHLKC